MNTLLSKISIIYNRMNNIDILLNENKIDESIDESIDLPLFFDLLHVAKDIIKLVKNDDILILIGDTPSYVTPFLSKYKTYNLAISNKAYGCVESPHSKPMLTTNPLFDLYVPTKEQEEYYFNFLNTKTFLTKEYIKSNWDKIVLIDHSSGPSITGVSIFFNRYINNIKLDQLCTNFDKAKPLRFINLGSEGGCYSNIDYKEASKANKKKCLNYIPSLLTYIGKVIFYHLDAFTIDENYQRIVPSYGPQMWNDDPILDIEVLEKVKLIYKLYTEFINGNYKRFKEFSNIVKNMNKDVLDDNVKEMVNNLETKEDMEKLINHMKKMYI